MTLAGRGFLMEPPPTGCFPGTGLLASCWGASDARVFTARRNRPIKLDYVLAVQSPAAIGLLTTSQAPCRLRKRTLDKHPPVGAADGLAVAGAAGGRCR